MLKGLLVSTSSNPLLCCIRKWRELRKHPTISRKTNEMLSNINFNKYLEICTLHCNLNFLQSVQNMTSWQISKSTYTKTATSHLQKIVRRQSHVTIMPYIGGVDRVVKNRWVHTMHFNCTWIFSVNPSIIITEYFVRLGFEDEYEVANKVRFVYQLGRILFMSFQQYPVSGFTLQN